MHLALTLLSLIVFKPVWSADPSWNPDVGLSASDQEKINALAEKSRDQVIEDKRLSKAQGEQLRFSDPLAAVLVDDESIMKDPPTTNLAGKPRLFVAFATIEGQYVDSLVLGFDPASKLAGNPLQTVYLGERAYSVRSSDMKNSKLEKNAYWLIQSRHPRNEFLAKKTPSGIVAAPLADDEKFGLAAGKFLTEKELLTILHNAAVEHHRKEK